MLGMLAVSSEKQTQFSRKLRKIVWLLVTECEDFEECDVCGFHEIIEKEAEFMQVESYLRVAKRFLWRQEELDHVEIRMRESTMPVVKGQHVPTKESICMRHKSAYCVRHNCREPLEKVHMEVVQSTQKNSHKEMARENSESKHVRDTSCLWCKAKLSRMFRRSAHGGFAEDTEREQPRAMS